MILAIDVGNTNIVLGGIEKGDIIFTARLGTNRAKTEDEYAMELLGILKLYSVAPQSIEGGIISSVVPELKPILQKAMKSLTGKTFLMVGCGLKTGLNIKIDNPAQLGSDLVVDAVAAQAKYTKPIVIFDMGTATTMSVIDSQGVYIGGMIIPGLRLSVDSLSANTAQLPYISLEAPSQLIGTNTINCMTSGAIYGNAAMLDGIIDRVEAELGKPVTAVATGGLFTRIADYCRRNIIQDENLLLDGLYILYQKNRDKTPNN